MARTQQEVRRLYAIKHVEAKPLNFQRQIKVFEQGRNDVQAVMTQLGLMPNPA